jgi:hypothetical protein
MCKPPEALVLSDQPKKDPKCRKGGISAKLANGMKRVYRFLFLAEKCKKVPLSVFRSLASSVFQVKS